MGTNIIVAHDQNLGIGKDGDLPWRGRLPRDMAHFKALTIGNTVVMGRRTYESIGHPLPERHNIVVSRNTDLAIEGVTVVNSFEQALEFRQRGEELFIMGGATIYNIALPFANKLYVTRIRAEFEVDSFFVDIDEMEWKLKDTVMRGRDAKNEFDLEFRTYERI